MTPDAAARAWTEVERYVADTLGHPVTTTDDIYGPLHALAGFIARSLANESPV